MSDIIERAIQLAAVAHSGQFRKGTRIPYVVHPFAVGVSLLSAGASPEVVAAGILHDTIEDTDVTYEQILGEFGPAVAAIVQGCSEPDRGATWEERKRHTHAYLETASPEIRLVACADKLHNIRSMAADRAREGEAVWRRFKRGHDAQRWYFRGLVAALCRRPFPQPGAELFEALERAVEELFGAG